MSIRAPAAVRVLRGDEPRERPIEIGFGASRERRLFGGCVRARPRARRVGHRESGRKRGADRGSGEWQSHDNLFGLERHTGERATALRDLTVARRRELLLFQVLRTVGSPAETAIAAGCLLRSPSRLCASSPRLFTRSTSATIETAISPGDLSPSFNPMGAWSRWSERGSRPNRVAMTAG